MSWENMTGREIKRIQEKDCKYCKNSIKISSADSGCDYLAIHKKEDHANRENAGQQEYLRKKKGEGDMGSRIPVERQEVKKAKELYAAGYDIQEISLGLNRTGNTVRRMIHGLYDNLEPKPKQGSEEKPLWKICFGIEWTNTVNKLRKAMGKEPI